MPKIKSNALVEHEAEEEPNVHGDGGEPAVVAGHDAETLKE